MRILQVITEIEQGGAEKQLAYLAYLQEKQGHEVYLAFLEGKGELKNSFIGSGVTLYPAEARPSGLLGLLRLARFVQLEKIEIIHAHLPKAELFAAVLSKVVGAKLIVTKHNCERFWPHGIARKVESKAAKVICISDSVKVFLQKCKELSNSKKCEVIYYSWIESDFFKPREWTGWQEPSWFRDA